MNDTIKNKAIARITKRQKTHHTEAMVKYIIASFFATILLLAYLLHT